MSTNAMSDNQWHRCCVLTTPMPEAGLPVVTPAGECPRGTVREVTKRKEAEWAAQKNDPALMREIMYFDPVEPVTMEIFLNRVLSEDRGPLVQAIARAHDPSGDGLFSTPGTLVDVALISSFWDDGQDVRFTWERRMRKPSFGETNLGAMSGAVVGAIGGLFAIALPAAIIYRVPSALLMTPKLNLICFLAGGTFGWFFGGQIGPRIGQRFYSPRAEIIAGGISGLLPVAAIACLGWYIVTR